MALMSEFQEERDAVLKHGTWKQKASYIWEYYKWHIIIPIVAIVTVTCFIVQVVTAPDILLNGVLLNVYPSESSVGTDDILKEFYQQQNINSKDEEISLNSSLYYSATDSSFNYESSQALMTWAAAGQIDFMTGDSDTLTDLAYRGYFMDLREILTEEQISTYEPYFLYMDMAVYEERNQKADNLEDVSEMEYPDCTKPDDMKKPVPVFLNMNHSQKLTSVYGIETDTLSLGFVESGECLPMATIFLDYLLENEK